VAAFLLVAQLLELQVDKVVAQVVTVDSPAAVQVILQQLIHHKVIMVVDRKVRHPHILLVVVVVHLQLVAQVHQEQQVAAEMVLQRRFQAYQQLMLAAEVEVHGVSLAALAALAAVEVILQEINME